MFIYYEQQFLTLGASEKGVISIHLPNIPFKGEHLPYMKHISLC